MVAERAYSNEDEGPTEEARHLRALTPPKFSAMPHSVLFDDRLSRGARLLYAILQAHWWQSGECYASHELLADEMGEGGQALSVRQLRRYLDELIAAGHVCERRRGVRRAKVYAPPDLVTPTAQSDTGVSLLNRTPVSDCQGANTTSTSDCQSVNETPVSDYPHVNRTPVSRQSDTGVSDNRTPVSDSKKKTPVRRPVEEDELTTASQSPVAPTLTASASESTSSAPKRSKAEDTRTRIPEDFAPTEKMLEWARTKGVPSDVLATQSERFIDYWRSTGGARGKKDDWPATWRVWMGQYGIGGQYYRAPRPGSMREERAEIRKQIFFHAGGPDRKPDTKLTEGW